MLRFKQFIAEMKASASDSKHLEHPEDRVFDHGQAGAHNALSSLHGLHGSIHGQSHKGSITTQKMDGAPAVFFGKHPETGKFFVGTKSVFNKKPKINYSHKDIEENHGHAPGLVQKLKLAYDHLPKIMPKHGGVYQGDIMHGGDVEHHDHGGVSHTPNTITYSAAKGSRHAEAAKKAKIGVSVHTRLEGPLNDQVKPNYDVKPSDFNSHEDVHNISHEHDHTGTVMHKNDHDKFMHHATEAQKHTDRLTPESDDVIAHHGAHLKMFINQRVRDGVSNDKATHKDYKKFLAQRAKPKAGKDGKISSSAKATAKKAQELHDHLSGNEGHIDTALAIHHHVTNAKNALVRTMDNHVASGKSEVRQTIEGKPSAPEGYVHHHDGTPTKMVNRHEFARANFGAGKPGDK